MDKDVLQLLIDQGLSSSKIALQLGVSKSKVLRWAHKFDFVLKPKNKLGQICTHDALRASNGKCRECENALEKLRRIEKQKAVWEYLEANPCPCGESDPIVLEFDHRNPETKKFEIGEGYGRSLKTIFLEIEKCDVLCVKCHRRKTAKQFGHYAWLG